MHHPPDVRFLVNAPLWSRRFFIMFGTLAALQVSGFVFLNPTLTWQWVVVAASFPIAIVLAWFWRKRSASGLLHWSGVQWHWTGFAGCTVTLKLHFDFQTMMLVSLHRPSGPAAWLWLQRTAEPYHWLSLRRAVVHATSPEHALRADSTAPARHTVPL